MEAPSCSRDRAAVATTAEGDQPRSEIVRGRSARGETSSATSHGTSRGNKLADPHDFSDAFSTAKRTAVLTEEAICVPALTPFGAKCDGERSAPPVFICEGGERRKFDYSSWVQKRGCHGAGVVPHAAPAGVEADPGDV